MCINEESLIDVLVSWLISVWLCGNYSQPRSLQPFHLKQCRIHMLPQHETERQWRVNNNCSCLLGNQGFTRINELISELLSALIAKHTTYHRKDTDSKPIKVADCKACKQRSLAVKKLVLILYNYLISKRSTLNISTDGPGTRQAENQSNSHLVGDLYQIVPNLTIWVY